MLYLELIKQNKKLPISSNSEKFQYWKEYLEYHGYKLISTEYHPKKPLKLEKLENYLKNNKLPETIFDDINLYNKRNKQKKKERGLNLAIAEKLLELNLI